MTKQDIKNDLRTLAGGAFFIGTNKIIDYLGYSQNSYKDVKGKYLAGLPKVGSKYYIDDVAARIYAKRD